MNFNGKNQKSGERARGRARSACPRARAQLPPLWLLSLHRSPWFQMVTASIPYKVLNKSCAKDTWADARRICQRAPDTLCCHRASPAARATDPCGCACASYATAFVHGKHHATGLDLPIL